MKSESLSIHGNHVNELQEILTKPICFTNLIHYVVPGSSTPRYIYDLHEDPLPPPPPPYLSAIKYHTCTVSPSMMASNINEHLRKLHVFMITTAIISTDAVLYCRVPRPLPPPPPPPLPWCYLQTHCCMSASTYPLLLVER